MRKILLTLVLASVVASAQALPPNRSDVVQAAQAARPDLLLDNTHQANAEFLQRVLVAMPEEWGHLTKAPGENGVTLPNGIRVSHDVIVHRATGYQVDVITGAGDHPNPGGPTWGPIDPQLYRPHNVFIRLCNPGESSSGCAARVPVTGGGGGPPARTRLGVSWFSLMAGVRHWPAETDANLDVIVRELNPDVVRIMAVVGGGDHTCGGCQDPWRDAGSYLSWHDYREVYRASLRKLESRGLKAMVTIFGGRAQTPRFEDMQRAIDRVVDASTDLLHVIDSFELVNEYDVNGYDQETVRRLAAYLATRLPAGFPIALSTPAAIHHGGNRDEINAEVRSFYGGSVANFITTHWFRGNHIAPDLGPAAPRRRYNSEPRGPGASTGGDVSDVNVLLDDYRKSVNAGYDLYVFHTRWGVFNGRIPSDYCCFPERNIWEHQNFVAIANALRHARHGTPGPVDPPPPVVNEWLMPGDKLLPGEHRMSADGRFMLVLQSDANLVFYEFVNEAPVAVWNSRTQNDGFAQPWIKGATPIAVYMQEDGNMVLYVTLPAGAIKAAWNSRTQENPGAKLLIQNDRNAVIYDAAGRPIKTILDGGGVLRPH